MNREEFRKCIIEMVEKISDEDTPDLIYQIIRRLYD